LPAGVPEQGKSQTPLPSGSLRPAGHSLPTPVIDTAFHQGFLKCNGSADQILQILQPHCLHLFPDHL
uniref:Uncharacterized protein n=1 Tax=Chelonoidis abingdonii TaxID=106734 RepID=A0A8C0G405_CHEAB